MASPVGWGLVGFGWVARDYAAPALRISGHPIIGIHDPDPRARATARSLDLPAFASLADLLAAPGLEAVYVATPNHLHRAGVEAAAAAGKAVLCEKPMAQHLTDAEAMAAAVRGADVLYGTAFDQRHHPAHVAMRDTIASGAMGTVTAIRIVYACWLGPDWGASTRAENWRVDPARAGGGALMDLAPHGIDLVCHLLGEPLVTVSALTQRRVHAYDVDDGAMLIGRTARGVLATLHIAYNHADTLPRRRLEVIGTGGMLIAENTMGQDAGGTVLQYDAGGGARPLAIDGADQSPFTRQMQEFSRAVRGERTGTFDLERDLETMRLLDQAYASAACH